VREVPVDYEVDRAGRTVHQARAELGEAERADRGGVERRAEPVFGLHRFLLNLGFESNELIRRVNVLLLRLLPAREPG
jgi:hypothetical protein